MDTILVICYSYTGTSRRLAELLCSQRGWPMGEVVDKHPRSGGVGTLRCVFDSLLRRHPAVRYEGPAPEDFRTVVLCAPVWLYRLAAPMRSFVFSQRHALRRVALILTMGSGGASNAVAEIAHVLGHPPILVSAFRSQEVEDGSGTGRLFEFADELLPPSTEKQVSLQPAAVSAMKAPMLAAKALHPS